MRKFQATVKLISNRSAGRDCFRLAFTHKPLARSAVPGQFIMVDVPGAGTRILRRPFGVHRVSGDTVEILYEIVGKFTAELSRKQPGEEVGIIGPLGNGFDLSGLGRRRPVLVAGGMGVAPLRFLAEKMVKLRPLVLIGGRSKEHARCAAEFGRLGCAPRIATDDGSRGYHGFVTRLLEQLLDKEKDCIIFACGPRPMLKEVCGISRARGVPAQVSLEEHMACGIGACLGCVVNTISGYKRVCHDGPVFSAGEIIW